VFDGFFITGGTGTGSQTSFRGVTENIMHQTNIGTTCEGDLDGDGEVSLSPSGLLRTMLTCALLETLNEDLH
jgi:hypothetical protein